jgi:hypothetical protein
VKYWRMAVKRQCFFPKYSCIELKCFEKFASYGADTLDIVLVRELEKGYWFLEYIPVFRTPDHLGESQSR